jgi:hypothetical protein
MKRLRRVLTAATTAAVSMAVMTATCTSANAAPVTPGATALSLPAYTGTATLGADLALTGALGGLLDGLISPIVSQDLNPLIAALQSMTVNNLVNSALGTSSPYTAGTPNAQTTPAPAAFPTDGLPSPCGTTYGLPCYNATSNLSPNLGPLSSLAVNLVSGYTQQVAASADATNPIFGRAQIANPTVRVLPSIAAIANPVATVGAANSKANCPNDNSAPTALASATNVSMLNGLVQFNVSNGDIANLSVNGVAYATVSSLPALTIGSVTVQPFGSSAIKAQISLSASQLINALGLPSSAVTALLNYAINSTMTLTVIAGPNTAVTSTSAKAWGIGVSVDLAGTLGFNLLGLVGATVSVPTGITNGNYGNVLDLRLGYTSCTSGSYVKTTVPPVPPAMV